MASISKREGSKVPWTITYRDHTRRQRTKQFALKGDAEAFKIEIERRKQTGRLDSMDAGTQSLAMVAKDFFDLHKSDWSYKTRKDHGYVWNACVLGKPSENAQKAAERGKRELYPRAEIADLPVAQIRRKHVQAFKVDAANAGIPETSVKRALQLIRRTLNYAADEVLIDSNPAMGVAPPKKKPRADIEVVTPEQVEKLRAAMPTERDKLIISIMAYAGLRPAELRALDAKHVGTSLRVEAAASYDGQLQPLKAGTEKRNVPICAALADDFKEYGATRGTLFKGAKGGRMTKTDWDLWRKYQFANAVEASGVKISIPYELRHSIASMWLREGIDPLTVTQWLGTSIEMLHRHYSHVMAELDPDDKRKVDEQIADARSN